MDAAGFAFMGFPVGSSSFQQSWPEFRPTCRFCRSSSVTKASTKVTKAPLKAAAMPLAPMPARRGENTGKQMKTLFPSV